MTRRVANAFSNRFSIVLSDPLARFARRYAFEEGVILSEIFEEALTAWFISEGKVESRTDIENIYQLEK